MNKEQYNNNIENTLDNDSAADMFFYSFTALRTSG